MRFLPNVGYTLSMMKFYKGNVFLASCQYIIV